MKLEGLYGIADASFGDPEASARMLAEAGACAVQLRCKGWPEDAVAAVLERLRTPMREAGVPLIINDFSTLCHLADGLHLGQDDGPFPDRSGLIRGRSTHSVNQLHRAVAEGAHYVGFGPIYGTLSKADLPNPRGLIALREIVALSSIPVVAIGGITAQRLPELRATGVRAWAAISDVLAAQDPLAAARQLTLPPGASP